MFHPSLNYDKDSAADPLNPTVNYTHWRPSPEQSDPYIPLAFKIYGLGGLVIFVGFLTFVVVYVVYREVKHRIHSKGEDDEEILHVDRSSVMDAYPESAASSRTLLEKSDDFDIPAKPSRVIPSGHPCLGISGPQEASLLEPNTTELEEKEVPFLKHAQSLPRGILKTSPTYIARPRSMFIPDDPVSPFEIPQDVIHKSNNISSPSSQEMHIVHPTPRRVSISVPHGSSTANKIQQPPGLLVPSDASSNS